jgi:hypothetical protein
MTNTKLILSGIAVSAIVAIGTHFMIGVSAYNYANSMEANIVAQYDKNRNSLSSTTNKIKEMFSVRDEHYNGLKEIIASTMSGRYGNGGSKAVFQFLKENNLKPDSSLDKAVQNAIDSGRSEFKASQDNLITLKASYNKELGSYFYGGYIQRAGYPKIDLNKYDIIINGDTQRSFDTKVDETIKLR